MVRAINRITPCLTLLAVVSLSFPAMGACTDGVNCPCDCLTDSDGAGNNVGGYANTTCQSNGLYTIWNPNDQCTGNGLGQGGVNLPCCTGVDTGTCAWPWCEDFDKLSWNDGTGQAWDNESAYIIASGSIPNNPICLAGEVAGIADEGTDAGDCYNFVTDAACDVSGETNCAIGNMSLGNKFDEGWTHGIFGRVTFAQPTGPTFGVTQLMKWSANLVSSASVNGQMAFKHNQWGDVQSTLLGQNRDTFFNLGQVGGQDSLCQSSSPTPTTWYDRVNVDMLWGRSIGLFTSNGWCGGNGITNDGKAQSCCTGVGTGTCSIPDFRPSAGVSCPLGRVYVQTESSSFSRLQFSPTASVFPGGEIGWGEGQSKWACLSMRFVDLGTADATIEMWFMKEGDVSSTKIMSFSGLDTTDIEGSEFPTGWDTMHFDNYWNGFQGGSGECPGQETSGDCGYASSACNFAGACTYVGAPRAYRYEDNFFVTRGEPVPCEVAMAEILGAGGGVGDGNTYQPPGAISGGGGRGQ